MNQRTLVRTGLCILGFILSGVLSTSARMLNTAPSGEIPFTIGKDHRIYVTASANGSSSLRFLVDTGASSLILNTRSPKLKGLLHDGHQVNNLGTSGSNSATFSSDNTLQIGTIRYEQAGCAHIPFPPEYWDGVMGLNALSAFNIEINYDSLKIYCYPKEHPITANPEHIALPFTYKYDVPFVTLPIKLNGKTLDAQLEVDTGSDRVIDLSTPFVSKHKLLETQKPFATSHIAGSDGGNGELGNVLFDEVRVGPYRMPRVAGAFSTLQSGMLSKADIDGMIGNNFLKRFNMLIDFTSKKIYLEPNNNLYSPFYDLLIP